jgi:cell division protein FtsI (penicillin-binding protein 3)
VLDVTGIIRKSSNVGAAKLAALVPDQEYYEFLRKFGYGSKTGSGFPGEAAGSLPPPDRWCGTCKQTISYGYGLSATPLQIAHAYATIANGGNAIAPTFVKGQRNEPVQVITPEIARQVLHMMQTVTEPGGTATQAAILGYHVAGKTGTARKASGGGYSREYFAFFAGVVPVDNPRFAMAVVIDNPTAGSYYGGLVSAPVFHNVMEGALRLMDVPPDDIETWIAAQEKKEAKPVATSVPQVATMPVPVDISVQPAVLQ